MLMPSLGSRQIDLLFFFLVEYNQYNLVDIYENAEVEIKSRAVPVCIAINPQVCNYTYICFVQIYSL